MQEIKKHVRKRNKILQQISNKITEIDSFNVRVSNMGLTFCNNSCENFPGCVSTYRGYKFNKFILQNNQADACCLISPNIKFLISEFVIRNAEEVVIGKRYLFEESFFDLPMNSSEFLNVKI